MVLYFYPADDTSGCTTQACDVRDAWGDFERLGVDVAGISPDDHHSHAAFAARYQLPHSLLADPERSVIGRYGAWGEKSMYGRRYMGVRRSTFVIDPAGRVERVFENVKAAKHDSLVLDALGGGASVA